MTFWKNLFDFVYYLAGNGGRRQQLRRRVAADVDGPGPAATTAGRPDWIADPAGSFRLDCDCCRPWPIVQEAVAEVVGSWPAKRPSPGDEVGRNWAGPIPDVVAVVVVVARKAAGGWPRRPCRDKVAGDGRTRPE